MGAVPSLGSGHHPAMTSALDLVEHRRRALAFGALSALGGGLLTRPVPAQTRVPRIGLLYIEPPKEPDGGGFGRGMRDLGYVEGRNVAYELRHAGGLPERLPVIATELVAAGWT
jgi:hypothetical protein